MRTFTVFLEEKESEERRRKELKKNFVEKLGFNAKNIDSLLIKVRDLNKSTFKQAVESLGIDQDAQSRLINLARTNPDTSIQNILLQLDDMDLPENPEDTNPPEEQEGSSPPNQDMQMQNPNQQQGRLGLQQ